MSEQQGATYFLQKLQEKRLAEAMRERRRMAIGQVSKVSCQVSVDGKAVRELVFDASPTLSELVACAGENAVLLSMGRQWPTSRDRRPPAQPSQG